MPEEIILSVFSIENVTAIAEKRQQSLVSDSRARCRYDKKQSVS